MGRRLIKVREGLRRLVGKPGRRSGVDRRKHLETIEPYGNKGKFEYVGRNTKVDDPRAMETLYGPEKRSGQDRRKKP